MRKWAHWPFMPLNAWDLRANDGREFLARTLAVFLADPEIKTHLAYIGNGRGAVSQSCRENKKSLWEYSLIW